MSRWNRGDSRCYRSWEWAYAKGFGSSWWTAASNYSWSTASRWFLLTSKRHSRTTRLRLATHAESACAVAHSTRLVVISHPEQHPLLGKVVGIELPIWTVKIRIAAANFCPWYPNSRRYGRAQGGHKAGTNARNRPDATRHRPARILLCCKENLACSGITLHRPKRLLEHS